MAAILVIDASASVRETLRIVLGDEHDVVALAAPDDGEAMRAPADLVILGLAPTARDQREVGTALAHVVADAPLLLLNAPGQVDLRHLAAPGRRVDFLAKPFDAHALRLRVSALLAAPPPRDAVLAPAMRHRQRLQYPFLSREAAAIVHQATQTDLPVLFTGERGSGATEVARALHFFRGGAGRLVALAAPDVTPHALSTLAAAADVDALFLEGIDALPTAAQYDLLALLQGDVPTRSGAALRILASTTDDLDTVVAQGRMLPELAFALSPLPVRMPPLRERPGDLPDLVATVSLEVAARLDLAPVAFTAAALERLQHYLWFGNVAELEAVLGRTLALRRPRVVDAADVVFLPEHAERAVTPRAAEPYAPAATTTDRALPAPNLEVLLGELAHELRNPMVTIKTFAQHLDSLLTDPEARTRFASLTAEAIGRMDTLLETLLDFARFRAPVRAPIDLGSLFEQALAEHTDALARKSIRIERNGAVPGRVAADAAQVLFALRSFVGGLVTDLVPHEPLRVTVPDPGVVEVHAHAAPTTAARLATFVEDGGREVGAEPPSLPFAIAATLLERNGGRLSVRSGEGGTTVVTVALTPAH